MLYIGVFLASMGFPALDNVVKEKVGCFSSRPPHIFAVHAAAGCTLLPSCTSCASRQAALPDRCMSSSWCCKAPELPAACLLGVPFVSGRAPLLRWQLSWCPAKACAQLELGAASPQAPHLL